MGRMMPTVSELTSNASEFEFCWYNDANKKANKRYYFRTSVVDTVIPNLKQVTHTQSELLMLGVQ
jgi:hypothetical protein